MNEIINDLLIKMIINEINEKYFFRFLSNFLLKSLNKFYLIDYKLIGISYFNMISIMKIPLNYFLIDLNGSCNYSHKSINKHISLNRQLRFINLSCNFNHLCLTFDTVSTFYYIPVLSNHVSLIDNLL